MIASNSALKFEPVPEQNTASRFFLSLIQVARQGFQETPLICTRASLFSNNR
jgi:hypothetical protein